MNIEWTPPNPLVTALYREAIEAKKAEENAKGADNEAVRLEG